MNTIKICIAGLGNVGSQVIDSLLNNEQFISNKSFYKFKITGISAKNKNKKRIFNLNNLVWYEKPLDLINKTESDIFIELIGSENSISYELIKLALNKKMHVVTANKALLAIHGNELFEIAEKNNVLLLFEAAIAGGIPIVKVIKQSIFLNKIKKISGILNGTTNFILSEMGKKKLSFKEILGKAQQNGYAEINPANDVDGVDSAHKLSLLSTLCFGSTINFDNVTYKGITNIDIEDIKNAEKLGYKIKLISESEIIDNKIMSVVEPKLIPNESQLANIDGVLNGVKIETDHLQSLVLKGEGAGGQATSSSIFSDLYEIALDTKSPSLGYAINKLIDYKKLDLSNKSESYYLRILVKDISGVLAKITSNLNEEGISIETILQTPDKNGSQEQIPIIIVTHETKKRLLSKALTKIEKLDFVLDNIAVITIDKSIN